jgi:hypothetical protein
MRADLRAGVVSIHADGAMPRKRSGGAVRELIAGQQRKVCPPGDR